MLNASLTGNGTYDGIGLGVIMSIVNLYILLKLGPSLSRYRFLSYHTLIDLYYSKS